MGTLHGAASRKGPGMAARPSPSPTPTAITTCQHPPASRPIPPKTQPGRCKVRFVMSQDPAVTLIQQVLLLKLAWILGHHKPHTTANAAPATAVSKTQELPRVNHRMFHIDLVRVQALWALPGRHRLSCFFLHSCNIDTPLLDDYDLHQPSWRHTSLSMV